MEFINFSNIREFIYTFLVPIIELMVYIIFLILGNEYYIGLKRIIKDEQYYILHKKIYIPFSCTTLGRFIKLFYKLITNYLLFTLFIFISFSYLLDSFSKQINILLPPYIITFVKFSKNDCYIIGRIWCHYPEANTYVDLYYKISSYFKEPSNFNSPFYLSRLTYSNILSTCKFSIILIIIINIFFKSSSKYKLHFRSFIVATTIVMIYLSAAVLYNKSIRYEESMLYQHIYQELNENHPIKYENEEVEKYIEMLKNYNSDRPDFKITFNHN